MKVYALQTARANSVSVPLKNIIMTKRHPLFWHNVDAAKRCLLINDVYISTDMREIINYPLVKSNNIKIINRPKEMCMTNSSHYDAILHGLNYIEKDIGTKVDILVILLGNNKGADPIALGDAINCLENNDEIDSVMSVGDYDMFNPYRAFNFKTMKFSKNGLTWIEAGLKTCIPQKDIKKKAKKNHNNKDAFGRIFFFNGSFWVCKREAIIKNNGLLPFPWLGKNIKPYIQEPHIMEIDARWQTRLL